MAEAYIIDAVRTPIGRKKGSLAGVHPADLGAHPIKALVARTGIDANLVDDVVWGCCDTIGPQAGRHRPNRLAGRGPAAARARHHHRPPVRIEPAGRSTSPRKA
jgi:acetyl-CoA acetyltransferase